MKFSRVLLGIFALLLSGAAITLSQEKKLSEKWAPYARHIPTSEQTLLLWGQRIFSVR